MATGNFDAATNLSTDYRNKTNGKSMEIFYDFNQAFFNFKTYSIVGCTVSRNNDNSAFLSLRNYNYFFRSEVLSVETLLVVGSDLDPIP